MLLLFTIRVAEDHLFEKELIIRYTVCFLCGRSSVCVLSILSLSILRAECGI